MSRAYSSQPAMADPSTRIPFHSGQHAGVCDHNRHLSHRCEPREGGGERGRAALDPPNSLGARAANLINRRASQGTQVARCAAKLVAHDCSRRCRCQVTHPVLPRGACEAFAIGGWSSCVEQLTLSFE